MHRNRDGNAREPGAASDAAWSTVRSTPGGCPAPGGHDDPVIRCVLGRSVGDARGLVPFRASGGHPGPVRHPGLPALIRDRGPFDRSGTP